MLCTALRAVRDRRQAAGGSGAITGRQAVEAKEPATLARAMRAVLSAAARRLPPAAGYVSVSLVLFAFLLLRALAQQWVSDFWEHAAVVRELATNPLRPNNPLLLLDAPHAFFSPYSLAVGLVDRLSGLGAIGALSLVGLLNLGLWLCALYWLVRLFSPYSLAPLYTLLFSLFLWGSGAWPYSGFFHLRALAWNIPYPSTFAAGLAFLGLVAGARWLEGGGGRWLLAVCGLSATVLVSHPISFAFLGTGLLALGVGGFRRREWRRCAALALSLAAALLLALAWPYYSLREVLSESSPFYAANEGLYDDLLVRVWPSLLALPALGLRLRANRRDPLSWLLLGLLTLYVMGGLLGRYSLGRMISFAVLVAQIALAELLAGVGARRLIRSTLVTLGVLAMCAAVLFDERQLLARSWPGRASSYAEYTFLADMVPQYDVVLTDVKTGLIVPTLGGKVVAFPHALAFVPDQEARAEAVRSFLADDASGTVRAEMIDRYQVRWLLLNGANDSVSISAATALRRLGSVVYNDPLNKLTLVRLATR